MESNVAQQINCDKQQKIIFGYAALSHGRIVNKGDCNE